MNNTFVTKRILYTGIRSNSSSYKGSMDLTTPVDILCVNANTDYKITGVFTDGNNKGFTTNANGTLTCTTSEVLHPLIIGMTDVTADKNCRLIYTMYKDGVAIPKANTKIDLNNPGKYKSGGINKIIDGVTSPQFFEVYVQSNVANTTVTVDTLMVTVWGDK